MKTVSRQEEQPAHRFWGENVLNVFMKQSEGPVWLVATTGDGMWGVACGTHIYTTQGFVSHHFCSGWGRAMGNSWAKWWHDLILQGEFKSLLNFLLDSILRKHTHEKTSRGILLGPFPHPWLGPYLWNHRSSFPPHTEMSDHLYCSLGPRTWLGEI